MCCLCCNIYLQCYYLTTPPMQHCTQVRYEYPPHGGETHDERVRREARHRGREVHELERLASKRPRKQGAGRTGGGAQAIAARAGRVVDLVVREAMAAISTPLLPSHPTAPVQPYRCLQRYPRGSSSGGASSKGGGGAPRLLPPNEEQVWDCTALRRILAYNPLRDPWSGDTASYEASGWKALDGNTPRPWQVWYPVLHAVCTTYLV